MNLNNIFLKDDFVVVIINQFMFVKILYKISIKKRKRYAYCCIKLTKKQKYFFAECRIQILERNFLKREDMS